MNSLIKTLGVIVPLLGVSLLFPSYNLAKDDKVNKYGF